MLKQKTLGGSFSLNGKGLHTGVNLTVTFNPAPDNHGYKIQRIDLEGQPTILLLEDVQLCSHGLLPSTSLPTSAAGALADLPKSLTSSFSNSALPDLCWLRFQTG